jgi:hypothetical protein
LSAEGEDQTRLLFTLHFLPGRFEGEEYAGADLPGGKDTAWQPGFLAGFHEFLDDLRTFLVGALDAEAKMAELTGGEEPHHPRLVQAYREYVRDNCPPA